MLSRLPASNPDRAGGAAHGPSLLGSLAGHGVLLVALLWWAARAQGEPTPEHPAEELVWVAVAAVELPIAPEAIEPLPDPPEDAEAPPTHPEVPDVPPDPSDDLRGFEELRAPDLLDRIPEPDLSHARVSAADFGGRGTPGGLATGRIPPRTSGGGLGLGGEIRATRPLLPDEVDVLPSIRNLEALSQIMAQLYPSRMRDLGIESTVLVQFVVREDGRIEEGSLTLTGSHLAEFDAPTRQALSLLRWNPARKGDVPVRVLVAMPVVWAIDP